MNLIDAMTEAMAKFDDNLRFDIYEADVLIRTCMTIAEAKEYLRTTVGEGRHLKWERLVKNGQRQLVSDQFRIVTRKIEQ